MEKLKAVPLRQKAAKAYINENHRHHKAAHADIFRVACESGGVIVGVVQVGRPVARALDDGKTVEVLRLCTNGQQNVCSFLYSRAARIAKELGYEKIITYILESESGTSLKASGWHKEQNTKGGSWDTPARRREMQQDGVNKYPTCKKQRYAKGLKGE